jgi:hypothetical protein
MVVKGKVLEAVVIEGINNLVFMSKGGESTALFWFRKRMQPE